MSLHTNYLGLFILVCISLPEILSLPDGAPKKVCHSMLPFHGGGIFPSNIVAPYQIETSTSVVGHSQSLRVIIVGTVQGLSFSGFMMQARNTYSPYQTLGTFSLDNEFNAKLMSCGSSMNNSVTHKNTNDKSTINLVWKPPVDFVGEVIFNATVAQSYETFWVGILSKPVRVVERREAPAVISISTTHSPYITQKTYSPQREPETPKFEEIDSFYTDCGKSKTCFGLPDGCVEKQNCTLISRISIRGDIYEFELKSAGNSPAYIGIGLSEDSKMGNDLVTECVIQDSKISLFSSLTSGPPNYGTSRLGVSQTSARLIQGSFNDGAIYCKVQRDVITEVQGTMFDLAKKNYHILLAMGTTVKKNGAGYHDIGRIASSDPINLAEIQNIYGSSNILLRLHGTFMVVAWIGTTSLGILLARYFKQTWVGNQICGKDKWFAWHRFCMIATWSLTTVAFVIIFIELKGWSAERNPHAVLGLITTILCYAQFICGLLRPGPTSKTRPLFNWVHWLTGNITHILAIITLFFSVKLTKAELPKWMDFILASFVVFHVVIHLIYSVITCLSDKHSDQRENTFQMENISGIRREIKMGPVDAQYSGLRKWLLFLYIVVLSLFLLILVFIIALAPIDNILYAM